MDSLLDEFDDWEGIYEDSEFDASPNEKADEDSGSDSEFDEESLIKGDTPSEQQQQQQQQAPPSPARSSSEAGDMTCAICLGDIPLENIAMVKGCDHIYCAKCILHWTLHRDHPNCPQCKQPFTYLLLYRTLDGELSDFPVEESVVLLKRARWFVDSIADWEAGTRALLEDSCLADDTAWHEYADEYDLAEDEAIEAFYFSSAAGRARVTLGNRRFGEGGFIAGGRRQARPVPTPPPRRGKSGGGGKKASRAADAGNSSRTGGAGASGSTNDIGGGGEGPSGAGSSSSGCRSNGGGGGGSAGTSPAAAAASSVCVSASVAIRTPNADGGRNNQRGGGLASSLSGSSPHLRGAMSGSGVGALGSSPGSGAMVYGSSPSGSGRRARRNARRAAAVVEGDV